MRSFRIEGAGVSAKNTDETFTASITSQSLSRIQATPSIAIVKITSNAAGNGKYNARILTGLSTATATTNLSMPAGMTVPGADNALFLNLPESGGSGHNLTTNSFAMGLIVGTTTETTPRKIVMGTSLSYACGS